MDLKTSSCCRNVAIIVIVVINSGRRRCVPPKKVFKFFFLRFSGSDPFRNSHIVRDEKRVSVLGVPFALAWLERNTPDSAEKKVVELFCRDLCFAERIVRPIVFYSDFFPFVFISILSELLVRRVWLNCGLITFATLLLV
jgi:hypothetical protein